MNLSMQSSRPNCSLRIGLDIDDTITAAPELFAEMSLVCRQAGGEVHIVTSRSDLARTETIAELHQLGVVYDFLHFIGNMSGAKGKCPHTELDWYQCYLWQKVAYAVDHGLTQFVDDDPRVLALFESYAPHIVAIPTNSCTDVKEPYLLQAIGLACRGDDFCVALVQRTFKLGYGRAFRLVERIRELGVIERQPSGDGWKTGSRYDTYAGAPDRFTVLFLDFDGVLHPEYEGRAVPPEVAFCHLARFEALMADYPLVRIVISSTWRAQFDIDNLRGRFAREVASRIIGITPIRRVSDGKLQSVQLDGLGGRESEIVDWLNRHGYMNSHWIALDDAIGDFRRYPDHVVACKNYVGFDDDAANRLRQELDSAAIGRYEIDELSS